MHHCAFSPTTRTWIQAIKKGHFRTWPGVMVDAIKQYLPKSEATTLGHLDQQCRNIQSTKAQDDDQNTMHTPSPLEQGSRTHPLCRYHQLQSTKGKAIYRLNRTFPCQKQQGLLNPGVQPRAGNPEVTGIPQVDYRTSRRQLTSTQAEVAYLINYHPITTKPAVITN